MFLHVVEVKHIKNNTLWLRFNDGSSGEVDLSQELEGKVFEPLQAVEPLKSFTLRGHTVAWRNGADFAPEFLKGCLAQEMTNLKQGS